MERQEKLCVTQFYSLDDSMPKQKKILDRSVMVLYEYGKSSAKLNKIKMHDVFRRAQIVEDEEPEKLLGPKQTYLTFIKSFINTGCLFLPRNVARSG